MVGIGKIRILLVGGEGIMRDGLRTLLNLQPDLEVIGESAGGTELPGGTGGLSPDVALVNLVAPDASSVGAIRQACQKHLDAKVIVLSSLSNRFFLGEALRAGVRGYVSMQSAFNELLEAIRTVACGLTYLCSDARGKILADYGCVGRDRREAFDPELTEREYLVLRLLGDGKSSKEIAQAQNLSSKTIDACRRHLMRKLNVDSTAGLVKYAILMEMTTVAP
jgi:DNA-binding NarL/FixJ family response regulator